jgi:uncharacterized protein (TIGR00266 family)
MSYQLQKGQNISLTRLAASLEHVAVGLGWDAHGGAAEFNLDSSAFMVDEQGKVLSDAHFIFFNQLNSPDGAVKHMGNNTTGAGEGDDEVITVNLARVEPRVDKIVFTATIYEAESRHQSFGQVSNAFIRMVDTNTRQEILRYDLTDRFTTETAMVFGELYRYKGEWKFRAIGQGFAGGLQAMADKYGVDSNDDGSGNQPTLVASATPAAPQSVLSSQAARMPGKTSQLMTGISGVTYELLYPGAYTLLKVYLRPNEEIKAESDAMVAMSSTIDLESKMEGGILGGLARKFLTNESFFLQKLIAQRGEGWALFGQAGLGDIQAVDLDGSTNYIVQKDGFLAGTEGVQIGTKLQNLVQGLASGEGFFVLKITGRGTLFLSSYGAIHTLNLAAGQEYIVDNNHLVAWADTTSYSIERASNGWISTFTSGEMLVCRFRGPGKVLIQTRNPSSFAEWLKKFLPPPSGEQKSSQQSNVSSVIDMASKFM